MGAFREMSFNFGSTSKLHASSQSSNSKSSLARKLSSRSRPSLEEAQKLVQRIARSYGGLSGTEKESIPLYASEVIANLQNTVGRAANAILANLRENKAQFVLELIKNAEDNDYKEATAARNDPYVQFNIHQNKIVIENNEDGFTASNVEAICKLTGSTKTGSDSQEYIGENGIGFKAVFLVASLVKIQSGPFSFSFEYPQNHTGVAMITPVDNYPDDALPLSLTRITLMLREDVNRDDLDKQFFNDIPDTILLFLKKLGRISINKYGVSGTLVRHTTYLRDTDERMRVTLTKVSQLDGNPPDTAIAHYYTVWRRLSNLPDDVHGSRNTAELCLAFPVDGKDVPLVATQSVYSYVPIESLGLHFLIHSGFRKQASWQAAMGHPRNAAILDEVGRAFVEAVLKFSEHRTLQYQWMRFLPSFPSVDLLRASQPEELRFRFVPKIKEALAETPALWSYNHDKLRLIHELRIIPFDFKDSLDAPLFADSSRGSYLATGYAPGNDTYALMSLGLQNLGVEDVMKRVQEDLDSAPSKLRGIDTPLDWHRLTAKFLLNSFMGKCVPRLKLINFIPLDDGTFTSILDAPIYFPESDGMSIPTDIGLRLIERQAIKDNKPRSMLFSAVGVKNASVKEVRQLILDKYKKEESRSLITLEQSVAHIRYLYWTHQIPLPFNGVNIPFGALPAASGGLQKNVFESLTTRGKPLNNPLALTSVPSNPSSISTTNQSSLPGTKDVAYVPTTVRDPNSHTNQYNVFQSMCFQPAFEQFSQEEHRLADYASSRNQYEVLWVFNEQKEMLSIMSQFYFPQEEFGVSEVLTSSFDAGERELPGPCLNSSYFVPLPEHPVPRSLSWEAWLKGQLRVQRLRRGVAPGDPPRGPGVNNPSLTALSDTSGTQSRSTTPEPSSSVS